MLRGKAEHQERQRRERQRHHQQRHRVRAQLADAAAPAEQGQQHQGGDRHAQRDQRPGPERRHRGAHEEISRTPQHAEHEQFGDITRLHGAQLNRRRQPGRRWRLRDATHTRRENVIGALAFRALIDCGGGHDRCLLRRSCWHLAVVVRVVLEFALRLRLHSAALRQPLAACPGGTLAVARFGRVAGRLAVGQADRAVGRRARHRHAAARWRECACAGRPVGRRGRADLGVRLVPAWPRADSRAQRGRARAAASGACTACAAGRGAVAMARTAPLGRVAAARVAEQPCIAELRAEPVHLPAKRRQLLRAAGRAVAAGAVAFAGGVRRVRGGGLRHPALRRGDDETVGEREPRRAPLRRGRARCAGQHRQRDVPAPAAVDPPPAGAPARGRVRAAAAA